MIITPRCMDDVIARKAVYDIGQNVAENGVAKCRALQNLQIQTRGIQTPSLAATIIDSQAGQRIAACGVEHMLQPNLIVGAVEKANNQAGPIATEIHRTQGEIRNIDRVLPPHIVNGVLAITFGEEVLVIAIATFQTIIAPPTAQAIIARITRQLVVTITAEQLVSTISTAEMVIT